MTVNIRRMLKDELDATIASKEEEALKLERQLKAIDLELMELRAIKRRTNIDEEADIGQESPTLRAIGG